MMAMFDEANPLCATPFATSDQPPGPLDLKSDRIRNWKLWKQMWGNYAVISNLEAQNAAFQIAMLENCNSIGVEALKVYNGFVFPEEEGGKPVNTVMDKFDQYIIGQLNETYEPAN